MKIALVHISDIHLRSATDVAMKRREKIANTISFSRSPEEQLAILITGDISNTGAPEEYKVAEDFFRPLFIGLGIDIPAKSNLVTFIPGNHDCNFHQMGDLRPRLLDEIVDQLEDLDENGETARALLQVQSDFFDFVGRVAGERIAQEEQIFRIRTIRVGDKAIELRCFNSAWLSKKNDEQGQLGFPKSVIAKASAKTDADVVISLVHHPSNWLGPSYQSFRRSVQESSDFLFTGHEHMAAGQTVSPFAGSHLVHFESGAFQPANSGDSEFGILHIDLDERTWRHETFRWTSGAYLKTIDGPVTSLAEKSERASSLQIASSFLEKLRDPGTGFLHPRIQKLTLPDIYVYPDLRIRTVSQRLRLTGDLPNEIPSSEVAGKLLNASRVVIAGPTDSGKTALSKMLVLEANTSRARPALLISGKAFRGQDPDRAFSVATEDAITSMYGSSNHGRYAALRRTDRILIIDDWDEIGFNRAGRSAILQQATTHFGCVIILTDDIFLIEELSHRQAPSPISAFEIADIREFGFRLRGQLALKWLQLGNTFVEDEQEFARNIADSTRVIDTVLGRNLLPSYPVNILTLLQTYDAGAGSQNNGLGKLCTSSASTA